VLEIVGVGKVACHYDLHCYSCYDSVVAEGCCDFAAAVMVVLRLRVSTAARRLRLCFAAAAERVLAGQAV